MELGHRHEWSLHDRTRYDYGDCKASITYLYTCPCGATRTDYWREWKEVKKEASIIQESGQPPKGLTD